MQPKVFSFFLVFYYASSLVTFKFSVQLRLKATMARFKATARLTNEGREIDTTDTAPISEIMKDFGMISQRKEKDDPKKNVSDAEGNTNGDDAEDDGSILSLSKPNHIEFGRSIMKPDDLVLMNQLGYVGKNDDDLVRFAGDEIILESKDDEVVCSRASSAQGFDSHCMR
jgi:hypothetical protein